MKPGFLGVHLCLWAFLALCPGIALASGWDWRGIYGGGQIGFARGASHVTDPFGAPIAGDNVISRGFLAGVQAGYNFQTGPWVYGIAADLTLADTSGSNSCFAVLGIFVSSNCRSQNDAFATVTGRLGHTVGASGRTLVYAKGGVAFVHADFNVTNNNPFGANAPIVTSTTREIQTGWTLGAGVERALDPGWSMFAEYGYLGFGKAGIVNPPSLVVSPTGLILGRTFPVHTGADQQVQQIKLGLNYHFNHDANAVPAPALDDRSDAAWRASFGARYWLSSGGFQKDVAGFPLASSLVSRLTYADVIGNAGELFGCLDSPSNVFIKGLAGLGGTHDGHLNDEDWGLFPGAAYTAYSNTLSSLIGNKFKYATLDFGYSFLNGRDYRIGAFAGYNYYFERFQANDCAQVASSASRICYPTISGKPVITEADIWQSLRVGGVADVSLTNRLSLSVDVAYLPYVHYRAVDNHWLRNLVIDGYGNGHGVQEEAVLSYLVTPQLSVGIGERYWSAWTTSGGDIFNGVPTGRTVTYRMDRYGVFLQTAYTFAPS